jgi:hypothetical protein
MKNLICALGGMWCLVLSNMLWATDMNCKDIGANIMNSELQFSLRHNQIPGELAISTYKLRIIDGQYRLEVSSQAKGLLALLYSGQLTQKSEGRVDSKFGLTPLYYAEQRGKKPISEVILDVEAQKVFFKRSGESVVYEKGLQDRISMIYQLAARLRCNNNFKIGDSFTMRVISTGRVANEVFTVRSVDDEVILNFGQEGDRRVSSMQFEIKPEKLGDEIVRLWFAKEFNWQPVKIQIQDMDGKSLSQTLMSVGKY